MGKATVSVKLAKDFTNIRLVVSKNTDLTSPLYSAIHASADRLVKLTIDNLEANTQYYYGLIINGVLQQNGRGQFKTFPMGASSFKCAFASCANTGSNHQVFDQIRNENPLFFIHMGDIHYEDIMTNDESIFLEAYDTVFSAQRQAQLYSQVPTAYVWDDHDYGMNDGDSSHPAKRAAQMAYRKRVPHYPLPSGETTANAINQSFVCGRVRFILTDIMSERSSTGASDNTSKTMFGSVQKQWLFDELMKPEAVKVIMTTKPWIGSASSGADYWAGYSTERREVANFIKNNGLEGKVMILSGDMHGLAIDNGENADYATGGGADIPVFQAAPLDRPSSIKGGSWSEGSFTNGSSGGQFGIMNVTDTGGSAITIEWIGKRGTTTLVSHTFSVPVEIPSVSDNLTIKTWVGGIDE